MSESVTDRATLIRWLWNISPLFLTLEEFTQTLHGWELEGVMHNGRVAVIFAVRGPEFHFAKVDPLYQAGRDILKRYPGEIIERHGYAITRAPKDDIRQRRFNERLGAVVTGETEHDYIFRFDRDRFAQKG